MDKESVGQGIRLKEVDQPVEFIHLLSLRLHSGHGFFH
jgi:hypothetical protein